MGIISWGIARVQKRVGFSAEASRFTHVGIEVDDGFIMEALGGGVVKNHRNIYGDTDFIILRYPNLSCDEISIVAYSLSKVNTKQRNYDYPLLFGLWLNSLGLPDWIVKTFDVGSLFICTQYLRQIFKTCQYDLLDDDRSLYPAYFYELYELGKLKLINNNVYKRSP